MEEPGVALGETPKRGLAVFFSREGFAREWPTLATLAALKLAVSALVLRLGFSAISDDDFARVVIAQNFAHTPKVDPSGTSWLPLPFFVTGLPMMAFGRSFLLARGVAVACGVLSIWLVYAAARLLSASKRAALLGAALAAVFPYSAWLGVATVPELPTAALLLFGVACSTAAAPSEPDAKGPALALVGGAALGAAAACRYEAWPVAFAAALLALLDARKTGERARLGAAGFALFFPLAWLLHGQHHYGDPFFFIKRVAEYKAALGAEAPGLPSLIFGYPVAIVRNEPELCFATLAALCFGGTRLRWRRPALLLGVQLLVLVVGDVRGGAPTHHPERAVLAIWLLSAVVLGAALGEIASALFSTDALPRGDTARVRRRLGAIVLGAALGPTLARPFWTRVGVFAPRRDELALGEAARQKIGPGETVAVATEDFGYFALMAGFAAPERCRVLSTHDPRETKTTAASGPEALLAFAAREGAGFAMLPAHWAERLSSPKPGEPSRSGGQLLHRAGGFALLLLPGPSVSSGALQVSNPPRDGAAPTGQN